MGLSRIQRLFQRLLPPTRFAALQEESKKWVMRCPRCDVVSSIWEIGGLRGKAIGRPRTWIRCPACGQRSWMTIDRRESGVGGRESGVGSRESGVVSRGSGVGSRESGVGSRKS